MATPAPARAYDARVDPTDCWFWWLGWKGKESCWWLSVGTFGRLSIGLLRCATMARLFVATFLAAFLGSRTTVRPPLWRVEGGDALESKTHDLWIIIVYSLLLQYHQQNNLACENEQLQSPTKNMRTRLGTALNGTYCWATTNWKFYLSIDDFSFYSLGGRKSCTSTHLNKVQDVHRLCNLYGIESI